MQRSLPANLPGSRPRNLHRSPQASKLRHPLLPLSSRRWRVRLMRSISS
jgi:hypothetical protein